jgi:spermidine synthase
VLIPLTIVLSAFLLFQIQLITAKWVLPWFGGSPSVWTACLLFYQSVLLFGYLYAHLLAKKFSPRTQAIIHSGLLFLSLGWMAWLSKIWANPVLPASTLKPDGTEDPLVAILFLLLMSIALPFLLLSSTSPLIQKWKSLNSESSAASAYRLYAISNIGSLLALITYPVLVEPNLTVRIQSHLWTFGYALFAILSVVTAFQISKRLWFMPDILSSSAVPHITQYALWTGLSACGSLMLVATTNQICREVAVVPFLWILPLAIYLLTFILCFERKQLYSRAIFHLLLIPVILLAVIVMSNGVNVPILIQVLTFSLVLFVSGMICHGELYRSKPPAENLTAFYVCVAAGGALGGLFAALVAPMIMKGFWEFHLGLWMTACLMVIALLADSNSWIRSGIKGRTRSILVAGALGALAFVLIHQILDDLRGSVYSSRNFYGVLTVLKEDVGTSSERFTLRHGRIRHGYQFTNPKRRKIPTSYYNIKSGVGWALHNLRSVGPVHVGAIGLGVGTIAAYGKTGDRFRFYEIDPDVAALAQSQNTYFQYLINSPADIDVVLGDGRVSMEREARNGSQNFDLLVIDAFNSDSIPAHLLTKEAMEVYLHHLKKPSGVLAFHISNRFLDLKPVIFGNAERFGLKAFAIESGSETDVALASTWLLLTQSGESKNGKSDRVIYWTDDYHSILPILKWKVD